MNEARIFRRRVGGPLALPAMAVGLTIGWPGGLPEHWNYLIDLNDDSVSGLSRLIKHCFQTWHSKYEALEQRARQFVINEKNEVVQGGSVAVGFGGADLTDWPI
jgi:hypothetical protein